MTPREMDGFGSDDLTLPELKLGQATGFKPEGCNPGDFYVNITDEIYPGSTGLRIIVADVKKSRTYWGRTELTDEPPVCSSMDMKVGRDMKACETCEFRCDTPWLIDAQARRTKCLIHYNLLLINYESKMPMVFRASGISTGAIKELNSMLRLNKELKGEYHRAIIRLVSEAKKGASGESWACKFKPEALITDINEAAEMRLLSEQLLSTDLSAPAEEIEQAPEQAALPAGRETQTITAKDVGKVEDVGKPTPPAPAKAKKSGEQPPISDLDF